MYQNLLTENRPRDASGPVGRESLDRILDVLCTRPINLKVKSPYHVDNYQRK